MKQILFFLLVLTQVHCFALSKPKTCSSMLIPKEQTPKIVTWLKGKLSHSHFTVIRNEFNYTLELSLQGPEGAAVNLYFQIDPLGKYLYVVFEIKELNLSLASKIKHTFNDTIPQTEYLKYFHLWFDSARRLTNPHFNNGELNQSLGGQKNHTNRETGEVTQFISLESGTDVAEMFLTHLMQNLFD